MDLADGSQMARFLDAYARPTYLGVRGRQASMRLCSASSVAASQGHRKALEKAERRISLAGGWLWIGTLCEAAERILPESAVRRSAGGIPQAQRTRATAARAAARSPPPQCPVPAPSARRAAPSNRSRACSRACSRAQVRHGPPPGLPAAGPGSPSGRCGGTGRARPGAEGPTSAGGPSRRARRVAAAGRLGPGPARCRGCEPIA
eukprot:CAMPEP_0172156330 /NCGR_PEP_ID=MMETSP1050-20130122/3138_1 /TAXON_ID=233186 /ORGANISM="Cryptomonas curvata, Strain CCAP979/52" /LENGTH=204 /DNA_ID=CAMNT_0012825361 /DNA_START=352 /DNA_END=963 /DNA_ORIENTATION=-